MLANWGIEVEKGLTILLRSDLTGPGRLMGQGIESLCRPRSTFDASQGFDLIPLSPFFKQLSAACHLFKAVQHLPDSCRKITAAERLLNEIHPFVQNASMRNHVGRIS